MSEKVIVTGAAGFIGSHLCESLTGRGFRVLGIDSFNDNYDVRIKRNNLAEVLREKTFTLIEGSLNDLDLEKIVSDASYVFHLAAQPGVRQSWRDGFEDYLDSNVRATQKLCEAATGKPVKRFVFASSSSVYGETAQLPMGESHPTQPLSPYGVTKLSAEALCLLYRKNFQLPALALRYFTVFGPRQRPDMAFHIFVKRARDGHPIEVFGNGTQTRDFTYVSDAVDATILAMDYEGEEVVFNIGGGTRVTLNAALDIIAEAVGGEIEVLYREPVKGDVFHTYADISRARNELGYSPKTNLEEGITREVEWVKSLWNKLEQE